MWHGYFGIEDMGLTAPQRQTLVDGLRLLGDSDNIQPARRNHWRTSLDSTKVIFEALFDEANISVSAVKNRIATLFGVDAGDIDHVLTTPGGNQVITFSYNSIDRIRMVVFAGLGSDWITSRNAVEAYILSNLSEWETEPEV